MQRFFLSLGDTRIGVRIHQRPGSPLTYVNIHSNEVTSVEAALAVMSTEGGRLLQLDHKGTRHVSFRLERKLYAFDPNRIFSDAGRRKTLQDYEATSEAAVTAVAKFAREFVTGCRLNHLPGLVAVHNNRPGPFSVSSYRNGGPYADHAAQVHLCRGRHPDDFVYVTERRLFNALARSGCNAVLQKQSEAPDDGSLSFFAARHGIPYLNVEAGQGHLDAQIALLRCVSALFRT